MRISVYSLHLLIACKIDYVASVIHHTLDSFDHLYISMHMHMRPFNDVRGSPFLSVPLSLIPWTCAHTSYIHGSRNGKTH